VREILSSHSFDHASFALRDDNFPNRLHDAQPILWDTGCRPDETKPAGQCDEVLFDFDVNKDENSPGTPRKTFMIVGDSMTQGREGDWTWRYRLWKWFQSQHLDMIRFVGPFTGTREPDVASAPIPPLTDTDPKPVEGAPRANGRYATTEAWDTNHYAIWGRQIAQDIPEIQAHVRYYQPDYILIMLGFNDLGWFVSDADGTLASMKRLIDEARAAKPNVRFAITNIPQRTYLGKANALLPQKTNDYNALITANVPKWSTAESRMELVKLLENYQCGPDACPAGSDGLHPNAKGDFQIASIFSKTLFDAYGIGKSPLSVPADADIPARAHPVPTNVVAVGSDVGVTVTWNAIFGVYGFDVRYRLKGFDWDLGNIASGRSSTGTTRFDTTWTEAGMEWEYQVRSSVGDDVKSDWSSSMVKAVATPKTPVRPLNIKVYPSGLSAIQVSWENPGAGANLFNVIVWDQDIPDSWIASHATRDLAYLYTDSLIPGHRYNVYVEAWNSYGGGIPGQGRSVYPGAGMTSTPLRLVVETIDPTTVTLSWVPVSFAVSYRVYVRRIDDGSAERIDGGDVTEATHGIWFLFPGVWHHEFCVTAMNGDLESGRSNCVIPPVLPGW
jgi:lysophospholipase L1-like esterase